MRHGHYSAIRGKSLSIHSLTVPGQLDCESQASPTAGTHTSVYNGPLERQNRDGQLQCGCRDGDVWGHKEVGCCPEKHEETSDTNSHLHDISVGILEGQSPLYQCQGPGGDSLHYNSVSILEVTVSTASVSMSWR